MFRLFVKLITFAVVIALSLYIGAQWRLNEQLKQIDVQLGSNFQFHFESAHLTVFGKIVVSGVRLDYLPQDFSMSINRAEYSAGNIIDMVFLSDHISKKELFDSVELSLSEVVVRLTPALVKVISLAEESTVIDFLRTLECGSRKSLGIKDYVKMGYGYAVFSTTLGFERDPLSRNLVVDGWLSLENDSDVEFQINLIDVSKSLIDANSFVMPSIKSLDLSIQDKGYNFRRNTYCSATSKSTNEQYIDKHIKSVKQKLASVGIKFTKQGTIAYKQLLQPNRRVQIKIEPSASFSFNSFGYYDEENLRELLNLDFKINDLPAPLIFDNWALDKLDKIEINTKIQVQNKVEKRFETISVERSFHDEKRHNASRFFGYKVKVITSDGKTIIGNLRKIEKNKFYIETSLAGGTIQRAVESGKIKQFFVYR